MRPAPSLPKRSASPRGRSASAVYAALAAQVAATTALVVFEAVRGERLAREIAALGGDTEAPGAQVLAGAATVFALLVLLAAATTAASAAAYLVWLAGAERHAGLRASRALAGWFVPVLNLVAPPVLLDRLWRASGPPAGQRGPWTALLAAWWLSWLGLLAGVVVRPALGSPGEASLTGLGPAELAAVVLSALLCAATVRQITALQTAGARRRRRAPAPRPVPQTAAQ
ncbi:DUF4328 domain-containing protein [Planomonospora venezuelensis]|uniref:DUF4328 domain-containing protein n=1 Tax=Planomonospora venezuelensis TaxID=1999 RepID=A0A841CXB6_PLAVE|nr:DUF4328 domain-containing protein [Planomonospora venezuelensis]MBB5962571.1 hypothetical protein [Planomonospora venezuelensis]GIM99024.1 hypothetical protein Pve01_06830 [Planomonospora venezuelensis]